MARICIGAFLSSFMIPLAMIIGLSVDVCGREYRKPIVAQDTAFMEMVYIHLTVDPKEEINGEKADYELLAIGDDYRRYGGYGDYQLDSIQFTDPEWTSVPTHEDFSKLFKELKPIIVNMMTGLQDSTVYYYGKIFINHYRYEEPIPKFNWKFEDETREVMGYDCRKATTRWRGRDWTAWYSDIPVSAGPWKFNGLPGLILRLEDSKGEHMFEAVDSKDHRYPIGKKDRLYCKTTREKYNAELRDYKENPGAVIDASGLVKMPDGAQNAPKRRQVRSFYNPIELE